MHAGMPTLIQETLIQAGTILLIEKINHYIINYIT